MRSCGKTSYRLVNRGPGYMSVVSEILIKLQQFSFKELDLKMSSVKWWSFSLSLSVLTGTSEKVSYVIPLQNLTSESMSIYCSERCHANMPQCAWIGPESTLCQQRRPDSVPILAHYDVFLGWMGNVTWQPLLKPPMMTSSHGNIFRAAGTLYGELTGHRWIPLTEASNAELWWFLLSAPE